LEEDGGGRDEEDSKPSLVTGSAPTGSVVQEETASNETPFGWTRAKLEPDYQSLTSHASHQKSRASLVALKHPRDKQQTKWARFERIKFLCIHQLCGQVWPRTCRSKADNVGGNASLAVVVPWRKMMVAMKVIQSCFGDKDNPRSQHRDPFSLTW
jgi:hypothetical protein